MGRAMSVVLVAAAIGLYHWRVLRADSAARPAASPSGIPLPTGIPSPLVGQDGGLIITITGATELQIRQAMSKLPDGANYTIQK